MELLTFHSSIMQNLKLGFLRKKIWRNTLALKSRKVYKLYSWKRSSLAIFLLQNRVSDFFFCCLGDKRRLSDFLRKWRWFHGHDLRLPKSIDSKLEFQKTETRFCRWASNDHNDISIFLSQENPCTFMLDLKSHF